MALACVVDPDLLFSSYTRQLLWKHQSALSLTVPLSVNKVTAWPAVRNSYVGKCNNSHRWLCFKSYSVLPEDKRCLRNALQHRCCHLRNECSAKHAIKIIIRFERVANFCRLRTEDYLKASFINSHRVNRYNQIRFSWLDRVYERSVRLVGVQRRAVYCTVV